jgi:ubiquinone/menaquinone biosynthesis C-methylase UbiE
MNENNEIIDLYRKRAGHYNFTANLYYLLGYREYSYRKKAVRQLQLNKGDYVVDLACGTGLNFSLIMEKIGPEGKLIGVDLTDAMLEKAKQRSQKKNWTNVELVHSDVAAFRFPQRVDAVLSTFALALCPEYDAVIRNAYEALVPGGHFVELSLKRPEGIWRLIKPVYLLLIKPFTGSDVALSREVWTSVKKYFDYVEYKELFLGVSYLVHGQKRPSVKTESKGTNQQDNNKWRVEQ